MSKEAMKLALDALKQIDDAMPFPVAKLAQAALREALTSVPDWASEAKEQPAQPTVPQDIPDLIAGALGVSRGTAYDMMREALAEQPAPVAKLHEQEPVAWMTKTGSVWKTKADETDQPLYTSPPAQRTWVGLTEDEAFACKGRDYFETYKAIEAKLKEKNT